VVQKARGLAINVLQENDLVNLYGSRYSPTRQPIFFSQLAKSFVGAPAKIFGPAKQVKAWLGSNAEKVAIARTLPLGACRFALFPRPQ